MGVSGMQGSAFQLGKVSACIRVGLQVLAYIRGKRGNIQLNGHLGSLEEEGHVPCFLWLRDLHCLRQCSLLHFVSASLHVLWLTCLSICLKGKEMALKPIHKTWQTLENALHILMVGTSLDQTDARKRWYVYNTPWFLSLLQQKKGQSSSNITTNPSLESKSK